jgi:hypothetical protein
VQADCAIEEGSGKEIGVARAPVDLESPVLCAGQLAESIAGLRVPAKRAVVFAAGQKKVRVLGAPRERKNALLMTSQNLDRKN